MKEPTATQIAEIRAASRLLVRELGFLSRNIAGTDLSPSAVHAVVEIGASGTLTSKKLGELLLLEKSSISRLVQSLIQKSLVNELPSKLDARVKLLRLTNEGRQTLIAIDEYAENRVSAAIAPLNNPSRNLILKGLNVFSLALKSSRISSQTWNWVSATNHQ